jgi:hypothetical protein
MTKVADLEGRILELDKESLKRAFPNLAKEMGSGENKMSVNSIRTDKEAGEKHATKGRFVDYEPDAIDFLRRCDTPEQGEEIIAFMEERGEIDKQYARRLQKQLREKGVRSFGAKKENDYYLRHGKP